ncbi:TPR-like protein [Hypoxylon sp. NC1633]|nr:TPR-like protein [Hypoxylon sp. NC1633]
MSHSFSSTFDALQAHFNRKPPAATGMPPPGSMPAPPTPAHISGFSQGNRDQAHTSRLKVGGDHISHNVNYPLPNTASPAQHAVPGPVPDNLSRQSHVPQQVRPSQGIRATSQATRSFQLRPLRPSPQVAYPTVSPNIDNSRGLGFPAEHVSTGPPVPRPSLGIPHDRETLSRPQVPASSLKGPAVTPEDVIDPKDTATDALLERQNNLNAENPLPKVPASRKFSAKRFLAEPKPKRSAQDGHGARAKKKRGHRKAAELTGDIKYRLSMASNAYMDGRLDEALKWLEETIRINSETHRAWVILASIHQEKGNKRNYYTAKDYAVHLQPKDIDGWLQCAEIAITLRDDFPEDGDYWLRETRKHYSAALRVDSSHSQARHGRAAALLELGFIRLAVSDYTYLVEHCIFDVYALRGFAEVCVLLAETGKVQYTDRPQEAIEAYRQCIAYFRANGFDPLYPFEWQDVKIFVELLAYIEQYKDAIHELRSLSRWLLTRSDEVYWDDQDDDREWDVDNARRLEVGDYQDGKYSASAYGSGLPLEFRTKLAVYRLKLGHEDEAELHLKFIDPSRQDVSELLSEHPDLVLEGASALYEAGRLPQALHFFEPLRLVDLLDAESLVRAGRCYLNAGDKRQAEECFAAAIDGDEPNTAACIDARYELAKMYEAAREEREAFILVNEAIRLQEQHDQAREEQEKQGDEDEDVEDNDDIAPPTSLLWPGAERYIDPKSKARPKLKAKLRPKLRPLRPKTHEPLPTPRSRSEPKQTTRRRKVFGRAEELQVEDKLRADELAGAWQAVRASRASSDIDAKGPSGAFMSAAGKLVDDFRSYKDFYTWDKFLAYFGIHEARERYESRRGNSNLLAMAERLSHNVNPGDSGAEKQTKQVPVSYRGVPFDEWLDLFLEYAIGLAQIGKFQEAYKVCESARDSTIFSKSKEDLFLIYVTWAACALRGRDEEMCIASARFLMREYQYDTDPFRMFAALSRLCPSPASWYASGPVQKYMLRQIKLMDRAITAAGADDSGDEDGPPTGRVYPSKDLDITLLMIYGHILFISNSFTYALNYFMRAYSLDRHNSMVQLAVGHCYVHYALKRQSENRQYLLTQGFYFLHQYYDNKVASPEAAQRQEAHYNLARSYHAVGIPHLAAQYYRRTLQDVPDDSNNSTTMGRNDLTLEAAYNLQQICWTGGDPDAATALGQKYLVL